VDVALSVARRLQRDDLQLGDERGDELCDLPGVLATAIVVVGKHDDAGSSGECARVLGPELSGAARAARRD